MLGLAVETGLVKTESRPGMWRPDLVISLPPGFHWVLFKRTDNVHLSEKGKTAFRHSPAHGRKNINPHHSQSYFGGGHSRLWDQVLVDAGACDGSFAAVGGQGARAGEPRGEGCAGVFLRNLLDDQHFGHHLFATRGVFWNIITTVIVLMLPRVRRTLHCRVLLTQELLK